MECRASSCRLRRSNEQIAFGGLIGHGISPPHFWMYVSTPRVPDVFRDRNWQPFVRSVRSKLERQNLLNHQPFFFYSWQESISGMMCERDRGRETESERRTRLPRRSVSPFSIHHGYSLIVWIQGLLTCEANSLSQFSSKLLSLCNYAGLPSWRKEFATPISV